MNLYLKIVLTFLGLYLGIAKPFKSFAEPQRVSTKIPLPEGALLPWQTLGIDPEIRAYLSISLEDAKEQLVKQIFKNPTPLNQYVTQNGSQIPSINATLKSSRITVGNLQDIGDPPLQLTIQPILGSIANKLIIAIEIADMKLNTVVSSAHTTIEKSDIFDKNSFNKSKIITNAIDPLYKVAIEKVSNIKSSPLPPNALHIGFSLSKENTRIDQGSALSLNLLLKEKLAEKGYTINREIGNDYVIHMRTILGIKDKMRRVTRRIILNWQLPKVLKFPLNIKASIRLGESVYASQVAKETNHSITLEDKNPLDIPIIDSITDFLNRESKALYLAEKPQVARIYGAWVYLDRGRAYGLKMNDRLILQKNAITIKGHVVGFFGARLRLKSPRGFNIHEGAIVYIRKGQKKVNIGDVFSFDMRKFPTKWPPSKSM